MQDIGRRTAVALGLGGCLTAASDGVHAQQPTPPARRYAERLAETRVVLSFAAEPDRVRRWLPQGWELLDLPDGPHRGATLFLAFRERLARQGPDGRPAVPDWQRYVVLSVSARAGDDGRTGFVVVRAWLPAATPADAYPYGGVRSAAIEREVAERSVGSEPAAVREAWTVRPEGGDGGGLLRLLLDYRRSAVPPRAASLELRTVSAAAVRPPVEHSYRAEQLNDVLRGGGADDPRLVRLELEATVPELREALGPAPRPFAVVVNPLFLCDRLAS